MQLLPHLCRFQYIFEKNQANFEENQIKTARQLGIATGKPARGWANALFYVLDQVDMLVGVWIVLGIVVGATVSRILWSVVFLFIAHQLLTLVGYQLGMRATAR
jgi:hypothetical protein